MYFEIKYEILCLLLNNYMRGIQRHTPSNILCVHGSEPLNPKGVQLQP